MEHRRQRSNGCQEQSRVTRTSETVHTPQDAASSAPVTLSSDVASQSDSRSRGSTTAVLDIDYNTTVSGPPLPAVTTSHASPMRDRTVTMVSDPHCDDTDVVKELPAVIRQLLGSAGAEAIEAFEHADEMPLITPDSLAELNMSRIINNPKLRNDVNFDRELHFRPNLDGSKGRQKQEQSNQYWYALEIEFLVLNYALTQKLQFPGQSYHWSRVSKAALVRLPKVFSSIRDILKTLVPDYDQKIVKERLDVDHIMQEVRNGVCDLIDLANWLSKILKNHCAPMRDGMVDSMRGRITEGAEQNDPKKLVMGLRQVMSILEAMKLDVANHQIRHMRLHLVDDTVNFQRKYNAHRIDIGKLSLPAARTWIQDHQQPFGMEATPLLALTRGLITDVIYNSSSSFCPPTFYLDSDRLRGLRIELHSRIYHNICRDVLREFARPDLGDLQQLKACDTLTISVAAIVGVQGRFADKTENIAAEIVRVLLNAEGRHPPIDADLAAVVAQRLNKCLRQDCHEFRQHATNLAERLIYKIQMSVHDHSKVSAIDLQRTLVPPAPLPKQSSTGFGAHCEPAPVTATPVICDPDADLIRRFTHILALNWQIWSPLVYLIEPHDRDDDDDVSDNGSDSTIVQSRTGSPETVPIAMAVYAPNRKWLPISVTTRDVPAGSRSSASSPKPENGVSATDGEDADEQSDTKNADPADDHFDVKNRQPA